MGKWIYIDDRSPLDSAGYSRRTGSVLDHRFNICQGLEPMAENVFEYLVVSILKSEYYGQSGYICVAYNPARSDGVSAIQTSRPLPDDGFSVEIITNEKSEKYDFTGFCKKGLSLEDTIGLFRSVLIDYKRPDIYGWINITDMIQVIHHDEIGGD